MVPEVDAGAEVASELAEVDLAVVLAEVEALVRVLRRLAGLQEAMRLRQEEQAREALARKRAQEQTETSDSSHDPEGQRVLEAV